MPWLHAHGARDQEVHDKQMHAGAVNSAIATIKKKLLLVMYDGTKNNFEVYAERLVVAPLAR